MRKRSTWFAIVAVAALLAAACGDDDDVSSGATSTTEEVTTSAEATTTEAPTTSTADRDRVELYMLPIEVGDDCAEVVAVTRPATADGGPADALDQLLAGPTPEEAEDVRSWFSAETAGMVNGVTVDGGVAEVDFQDFSSLMANASTSCGSASLLAQLDSTVLQFPEIDDVVYSFDGDRDAFYEWLQLSAPGS
jgi:spore germination protein GerM